MLSFDELNLNSSIMKSIKELGYEKPSPIQEQALPILLGDATDFIGLAATGTGKTAAFAIPLLQRIDTSKKHVQALVLCPTRELALQVAGQIDLLGKHMGIHALPIYGGAPYGDQIRGLRQGAMIVVGTPGRVVDHLERGTLSLEKVHTLILDEADEMMSMGFKDELDKILGGMPKDGSNIWLFSATMSREVRRVADDYLQSPKQVQVNRTEVLSTTVEQFYYLTHESNKPEILCKLIDAAEDFYGVVFCQTKQLVADLTQYLTERGYRVDCLHGDKDQRSRERTMQAFRDRKVTLLICTDVAARGLDVKDVTHVVNYSLPRELDSYVHRIGRTARSGKSGVAMSLVTPSHRGLIGRIEHLTKSKMKEGKIPTRKEVAAKKMGAFLPTFLEQKNFIKAVDVMDDTWKDTIAKMTPEEVAGRFLSLRFPEVFAEKPEPQAPRVSAERTGERPRGTRTHYAERRPSYGAGGGGGGGGGGGYRGNRPDRGSDRGPGAGGGDRPRPAAPWKPKKFSKGKVS